MILLPQDYWEMQVTAAKGRGIFAKQEINPGTVIGDYIGTVLRTAESDTREKDGLYLMYYHDYASLYPEDIAAPGVHLLNHSCAPNTWMYTYYGHTLFFALRRIFVGEELTVSYLLSPADHCNPCLHTCRCGQSICTGTMHQTHEQFDAWDSFTTAQAKQTKRARVRYGKPLPLLSSYPHSIEDHERYTLFGYERIDSLRQQDMYLPKIKELRRRIREHGRTLLFPKLKTQVLGIRDNQIISTAD